MTEHLTERKNKNSEEKKAHQKTIGKDISGQKFRMLTALYPTEKRDRKGTVIWQCRCDCGREVEVSYDRLLYSNIVSCGCRKKSEGKKLNSCLTRVAGTSVDILKSQKQRRDNKTGVTGVYMVRGKYRAEICFQQITYRLGNFNTLEEAASVRYKAEQVLHRDFLNYYAKWKKCADEDPVWGAQNPITVQVTRNPEGEFRISMSPVLEEALDKELCE